MVNTQAGVFPVMDCTWELAHVVVIMVATDVMTLNLAPLKKVRLVANTTPPRQHWMTQYLAA